MTYQPLEILLVEDNEDDIVLIQEALAERSLVNVMYVVRDGDEAMAYLRREGQHKDAKTPSLVLLDINMPNKNGFAVVDEMKAEPALRQIPVVMLTVSDRDEDVVKSYSKGACSYIRKPMSFQKLQKVIRQFALYWALVATVPRPRD